MAKGRKGPWSPGLTTYPHSTLDLFVQLVDVRPGKVALPLPAPELLLRSIGRHAEPNREDVELVHQPEFAYRGSDQRFDHVLVVPEWYRQLPPTTPAEIIRGSNPVYIGRDRVTPGPRDISPGDRAVMLVAWGRIALGALSSGGRAGILAIGFIEPASAIQAAAEIVASGRLEAVINMESTKEQFFKGYHSHTMILLRHTLPRPNEVLFVDARRYYQEHGPNRHLLRPRDVEFLANIVRLHRGEPPQDRHESADLTAAAFPEGVYRDVPGLSASRPVAEVMAAEPIALHAGFHVLPFATDFIRLGEVTTTRSGPLRIGDLVQHNTAVWSRYEGGELTGWFTSREANNRNAGPAIVEWLDSHFAPVGLDRDPTAPGWVPKVVENEAFQRVISELDGLREIWPRPVPNLFDAIGSGLTGWAKERSTRQEQIEKARAATLRTAGFIA